MTRYPSPEDAVDFLRLLNDHESDTVICLDPVHEIESVCLPMMSISIFYSVYLCNTLSFVDLSLGNLIFFFSFLPDSELAAIVIFFNSCRPFYNPLPIKLQEWHLGSRDRYPPG